MSSTGWRWIAGLAILAASCGPTATATLRVPVYQPRAVLDTPLEVETRWEKTCDESSIFDSNHQARKHRHPCEEQRFRVAITCSLACEASVGDGFTGWGVVTVVPLAPGPLELTVVMTRDGDGETARHYIDAGDVAMPTALALQCSDGRVSGDCGLRPLSADEPVVYPTVRVGGSGSAVPRTLTINGRPSERLMAKPGVVNLLDLYPQARRADGSLTPGRYPVTLTFHQLVRRWDLVVE
jgi:hypothetical protein